MNLTERTPIYKALEKRIKSGQKVCFSSGNDEDIENYGIISVFIHNGIEYTIRDYRGNPLPVVGEIDPYQIGYYLPDEPGLFLFSDLR
jgi:hypothetical protein